MKDETKKRIESLSTDEMLFEINRGRRSRFQRDSFDYLKTCYTKRLSEENKQFASEQSMAYDKTSHKTNEEHNSVYVPPEKSINLFKIAEGVIIIILGAFLVWICLHYCGLQLKP